MDYETAKQLKDAGFPQKTQGENINDQYRNLPITGGAVYADVTFPSLEEIIEALGENFGGLQKNGDHFEAWSPKLHEGHDHWKLVDGSTPKIVVAKLWLELQK